MREIHVDIKNKIATYNTRDGVIVCGNNNYKIRFTFDEEWNEHSAKQARFIWNDKYLDVVFTGDTVPVPVISQATTLTVGVYAGEKLRTTTPAKIPCLLSILCESGKAKEADYYEADGTLQHRLPAIRPEDHSKILQAVNGKYELREAPDLTMNEGMVSAALETKVKPLQNKVTELEAEIDEVKTNFGGEALRGEINKLNALVMGNGWVLNATFDREFTYEFGFSSNGKHFTKMEYVKNTNDYGIETYVLHYIDSEEKETTVYSTVKVNGWMEDAYRTIVTKNDDISLNNIATRVATEMETEAETIIGAINEVDKKVETNETAIERLNKLPAIIFENEADINELAIKLDTDAKTIIGAINELAEDVGNLNKRYEVIEEDADAICIPFEAKVLGVEVEFGGLYINIKELQIYIKIASKRYDITDWKQVQVIIDWVRDKGEVVAEWVDVVGEPIKDGLETVQGWIDSVVGWFGGVTWEIIDFFNGDEPVAYNLSRTVQEEEPVVYALSRKIPSENDPIVYDFDFTSNGQEFDKIEYSLNIINGVEEYIVTYINTKLGKYVKAYSSISGIVEVYKQIHTENTRIPLDDIAVRAKTILENLLNTNDKSLLGAINEIFSNGLSNLNRLELVENFLQGLGELSPFGKKALANLRKLIDPDSILEGIQGEVNTLKDTVEGVQGDIKGIQGDIEGIGGNITDIQSDVGDVDTLETTINGSLTRAVNYVHRRAENVEKVLNWAVDNLEGTEWIVRPNFVAPALYGKFVIDADITDINDAGYERKFFANEIRIGYTVTADLADEGYVVLVTEMMKLALDNTHTIHFKFLQGDTTNPLLIDWLTTYGEMVKGSKLETEAKDVFGAINELNSKKNDKIDIISVTGNPMDIAVKNDGILWENLFTMNGGTYTGDFYHRVPIVAGEGVEFEVDGANNVVKINATGGGSADTSNLATVDKIGSIDTWYEGVSELDIDDGIYWREGFAFYDEVGLSGNVLRAGSIHHRVPIMAGENVKFTVEDNMVKINVTGGSSNENVVSRFTIETEETTTVMDMINAIQNAGGNIGEWNIIVLTGYITETYGLQMAHYGDTVYNINGVNLSNLTTVSNVNAWDGVSLGAFQVMFKPPLPYYDESNEGQVLKIVNGEPTWVTP